MRARTAIVAITLGQMIVSECPGLLSLNKSRKRKGVRSMKYEAPKVVTEALAIDAVQAGAKGVDHPVDLSQDKPTIGAYESDE